MENVNLIVKSWGLFYALMIACIQVETDANVSEASPHIANIGRMVEDMENKIRNTLNEIYFGKTKDIVNGLRAVESESVSKTRLSLRQDLSDALKKRQASRATDNN